MSRARFPAPGPRWLEVLVPVRVRFHEVDALRIAWHGHYVTWLEEGREGFGRELGLGYQDVAAAGCLIPLVHLELDWFAPARHGDLLSVRTRLHPDERAQLQFTYAVLGPGGATLATGRTVQVFTDLEGQLLLTRPRVLVDFLDRHVDRLQPE